ncbi:MAG: aminopeptidase [Anaerolineales bacterium]
MAPEFDTQLQKYAELIVHIGLNLQKGQKLVISGKNLFRGAPLNSAPLVRQIAATAYKAGARLVDIMWDDDQSQLIRFKYAPRDSFGEYPTWRTRALFEYANNADVIVSIYGEDPDLLNGQDPKLVAQAQRTMEKHMQPQMDLLMKNAYAWLLVAAPNAAWAAKVFPDLPPEQQMDAMWQIFFKLCRIDQPDPVAAWKKHIQQLKAVSEYMNAKQYHALHYAGPGTDLTVGLPAGHIWNSAQSDTQGGITFTPNLPTEEIFTLGDKNRAEGTLKATMPLSYGGRLVEDFSVTFKDGRVVETKAAKGGEVLKDVLANDDGAGRVGEIALVPHSSPIAQSGLLFYNTLFDENAACHFAIGRAYRFTLKGGEGMSSAEFAAAGGNESLVHVDFMVGSNQLDIDGHTRDGKAEPVMRKGEWAFST